MKKTLLLSLTLVCGFSGGLLAQDTPDAAITQKIRDEGLNRSKVMQTAFYLTDVSGPRLSNSTNLKNAQNWAVKELKSYGLTNTKLEPWGKFGKGWDVEKNYAAITVPYYHAIIAIPKAWTPGTNGPIKSEIVLIKADTTLNMDQYKGKLKGKIIIYEPASMTLAAGATPDFLRYTDAQLDDMAKATAQAAGAPRRNPGGNPQMAAMMRTRTFRTKLSAFLRDENV
ncbi:MAG: peptidase M28, partial [Sphingobacteriaceae bacterium]